MRSKYDVFISYRRDRGSIAAEKIQHDLERRGFVCFRDKDSIQTGKYGHQIRQAIRQARYFIMVLTDGSVERCCDLSKDDWVREEIKEALRPRWFCPKDVVVPVVPEGEKQDFPSDNELEAQGLRLPAEIKEIREYQISKIAMSDYFDGCMNQLVEKRLGGAPRHGLIGGIRRLWAPILIGLAVIGALVWQSETKTRSGDGTVVPLATGNFGAVSNAGDEGLAEGNAPVAIISEGARGNVANGNRRTKEQAATELKALEVSDGLMTFSIRNDFQTLLMVRARHRKVGGIPKGPTPENDVERRIFAEVDAAMSEPYHLQELGMLEMEIAEGRPDLVMAFADIRLRVTKELRSMIDAEDYERALNYYNDAKEAFRKCGLNTLQRPEFMKRRSR